MRDIGVLGVGRLACFADRCGTTAFTPLTRGSLAPLQAPTSAVGFRVCVHKWLVLVRLLLGEVPDRTEFTAPDMAGPLAPYFDLTQAVRSGDLTAFRWAVGWEGLAPGAGPGWVLIRMLLTECALQQHPLQQGVPPDPPHPLAHPHLHTPSLRPAAARWRLPTTPCSAPTLCTT
jgi:hypothetical protein